MTMVGISVHHYTASSTSSTAPAWRRAVFWSTATRASLALLLRCWLISCDGARSGLPILGGRAIATTTVGTFRHGPPRGAGMVERKTAHRESPSDLHGRTCGVGGGLASARPWIPAAATTAIVEAEDLKLLLTPRSARAEAKDEDVWRPAMPAPSRRGEWKGEY